MAEENLNPKQSVAEPPAPEIVIRTMDSDIKAVRQGGGEMVAPKPFTFEERPKETAAGKQRIETNIGIPGYTGPEKPIFSAAPVISREESLTKKSNKWKIIGVIVFVLAIFIGLGLLGYFVIFPWLFPPQMPAV